MHDITITLKECILNNDFDTLKKLINDKNTDIKLVLSYLKKHNNINILERIDKWLYENDRKCCVNMDDNSSEVICSRNKRQKLDESIKGEFRNENIEAEMNIGCCQIVDKENFEEGKDISMKNCDDTMCIKNAVIVSESVMCVNDGGIEYKTEQCVNRNDLTVSSECNEGIYLKNENNFEMSNGAFMKSGDMSQESELKKIQKEYQVDTNIKEVANSSKDCDNYVGNSNAESGGGSPKHVLNLDKTKKDINNLNKESFTKQKRTSKKNIEVKETKNSQDGKRVFQANFNDEESNNVSKNENYQTKVNNDNKKEVFTKKSEDEIKEILSRFLTDDALKNRLISAFYNAMCSNTIYYNYSAIAKISQDLVTIIINTNRHKEGEFIRSKISNLKNSANPELCDNVVRSIIKPEDYLKLTNDEMKSKNLKLKEEKILQNTLMDSQFKQIEAETDMFKCSRCKNRKTTYSQLQTRSADEPMTTFVTCVVCKHRWKF